MGRVLIIPAAGLGSRLQSDVPKVLFPVNGRPMIDYLIDLYEPFVDRIVLVINPSHSAIIEAYCEMYDHPIDIAIQVSPTGMLDAILMARNCVEKNLHHDRDQVWITWCDQIAVNPNTVKQLAALAERCDGVIMPTVIRSQPYIHWVRNQSSMIIDLLQQREGDEMPKIGEGDVGLFAMTRRTYLELLPEFAARSGVGKKTSESNFLPFVPWVASRVEVVTFPVQNEIESIGINTRDELSLVEDYLNGITQTIDHRSSL